LGGGLEATGLRCPPRAGAMWLAMGVGDKKKRQWTRYRRRDKGYLQQRRDLLTVWCTTGAVRGILLQSFDSGGSVFWETGRAPRRRPGERVENRYTGDKRGE
jgi:hypothetical protein